MGLFREEVRSGSRNPLLTATGSLIQGELASGAESNYKKEYDMGEDGWIRAFARSIEC